VDRVPFAGLANRGDDYLVGFDEALEASDCVLDTGAIKGRNGYRAVINGAGGGAIAASGTVQGMWRFRHNSTTSCIIAVVANVVYAISDPTTDTASDGTATALGTVSGFSGLRVSGAQHGRYLYLTANGTWVRVKYTGSAYSYETIVVPAKGPAPSATLAAAAVQVFSALVAAGATKADAGGASSAALYTDWYEVTNGSSGDCPVGGSVKFSLTSGQAPNCASVRWMGVLVCPETYNSGGGSVLIEVSHNDATWVSLGEIKDAALAGEPGSPNVLWCFARWRRCSRAGVASVLEVSRCW
jgi:hypothetical protein